MLLWTRDGRSRHLDVALLWKVWRALALGGATVFFAPTLGEIRGARKLSLLGEAETIVCSTSGNVCGVTGYLK